MTTTPTLTTAASLLAAVRRYFPNREHSIPEHLAKETGLYLLDSNGNAPGGAAAIYLTANDMDADSDGARGLKFEPTHQSDTSLHDAHGRPLDANTIPYFVLPGRWGHGARMGDFGVAFTDTHVAPFICGDVGPRDRISEGSLELCRRLGHERVKNGAVVDVSIGEPVRVLIWPGSGSGVFTSVADVERRVAGLVAAFVAASST